MHAGGAGQQDFALLQQEYAGTREVVLSIDGLQPEKGHETLYVVPQAWASSVSGSRRPLLSSATEEIRPLIVQERKDWAERLGCRVRVVVAVRQARCVRQDDCQRVSGRAAPLLQQPFFA